MADGFLGMGGKLSMKKVSHGPHGAFHLSTPFGRIFVTSDPGQGITLSREVFQTSLTAHHFRPHEDGEHLIDGIRHRLLDIRHLGSGLITNAGVNLMANDFTWGNGATLKQMNSHLLGTGATAAAATDVFAQTPIAAGSLTGSTNGFMTGTQSYVSPNIYQTVATFTANASLAVTEWALCMTNAATVSRTSAGAAPTNNTFTDTGATFTTSGQGLAAYTIEIASSILNTPTTTVMGQILSNTSQVLTLQGPSASAAWLTLVNAVASTPGATVAYQVFPTAWDHKVFSVINLVSTDTLQMTYKVTVNSGG